MEKLLIVIVSLSFTTIVAMMGYWLKSVHGEFKGSISELLNSLHELRNSVAQIRTQITKSIESDIAENKSKIEQTMTRIGDLENQVTALKAQQHKA